MSQPYPESFKLKSVQDYIDSGLSQEDFSSQIGIGSATLFRWVKKYKPQIEYNVGELESLKGVSTLYDSDGNVKQRWVKTSVALEEQQERFESFLESLTKDIKPVKPKTFKKPVRDLLMTDYIISDFHLGQYSDAFETGNKWDLDTAHDVLLDYMQEAIDRSPNAKQAVLTDLGDFLHADGLLPITPSSGHVLDASGRFRDVVDVATSLFIQCINLLLEKHENVHVKICEGNHNINSSYWQAVAINMRYHNEPRVTVDVSRLPFYRFVWGSSIIFYHHGHLKPMAQIAPTMVAMFKEEYGNSEYAFCNVGHLHHKATKECSLMEVVQHQTLAAKDAHSARRGYASHRGAKVMTYHWDKGLHEEHTIRPSF